MPRQRSGDFDDYKYQQDYIKKNLKFVNVQFNSLKAEEMSIYDWLNKKPKEMGLSKAAYIKKLIQADMEKTGT